MQLQTNRPAARSNHYPPKAPPPDCAMGLAAMASVIWSISACKAWAARHEGCSERQPCALPHIYRHSSNHVQTSARRADHPPAPLLTRRPGPWSSSAPLPPHPAPTPTAAASGGTQGATPCLQGRRLRNWSALHATSNSSSQRGGSGSHAMPAKGRRGRARH